MTAGAEWNLTAGVGLSKTDGPYINSPQASLTAFVRFAENADVECTEILPASNNDTADWAIDNPDTPEETTAASRPASGSSMSRPSTPSRTVSARRSRDAASCRTDERQRHKITFNELTQGDVDVDADSAGR